MSPTPVLAQWLLPGDAVYAERMAKVALKARQGDPAGVVRPWVVWVAIGLFAAVLVLTGGSPVLLGGLVVVVAMVFWLIVTSSNRLAKAVRKLPTSHEPYMVTLDAEGVHLVGQSFADHLRWRVFSAASFEDGFLVLTRRGSTMVQALSLEPLDPRIDRAWVTAEVGRLIEADAVHVGPVEP